MHHGTAGIKGSPLSIYYLFISLPLGSNYGAGDQPTCTSGGGTVSAMDPNTWLDRSGGRPRRPWPPADHPALLHEGLRSFLCTGSTDPPEGAEGLLKFLKTPSIRAVPHRGDRLGDVCDKKDINMEKAAIGGERRFPLVGLRADTSSEQAQPILSQGPAPLEVSDTEDDLTFGPHPVAYQGYEGFATGAFPGFPPPPPRQEASEKEPKGPWWREMLASPVKRLKLTGWASPWKENPPRLDLPPAEPEITHVEGTKATTAQKPTTAKANDRSRPKPHRLDLAPRKTGLMQRKCGRSHAVGLAKNKTLRNRAVANIVASYYSNSSIAAKNSKRRMVDKLLKAANLDFPLTPLHIKTVAGALKDAGYKSTFSYLIEMKTMHIELDHTWSSLLDRHFKLCMAAAKRNVGPRKKAPEVPEDIWVNHPLLEDPSNQGTKVGLAAHLFACGVYWMMREIEIANLSAKDIKFDSNNRLVTVLFINSKGDQEARGVSRTLQCICKEGCTLKCPYAVLEVLVNYAGLKGSPNAMISTTANGKQRATKKDLVDAWRSLYGTQITGHSARRSGALQYIRKGWAVSQVGYLGRWKSNIILEYAQEALESMAVNVGVAFGHSDYLKDPSTVEKEITSLSNRQTTPTGDRNDEGHEDKRVVVSRLAAELRLFKSESKDAVKGLGEAIKELEAKLGNNTKYLPPLVRSGRHQVFHRNTRTLVYAHSAMWRTMCGWNYYGSTYEFVEGDATMVTCNKCMSTAPSKEECESVDKDHGPLGVAAANKQLQIR